MTVAKNAIGYVIVNVNGTNYTINLTAGEDRIAVKVAEDGLYNVTATYLGDDKYLPSSNNTTFKVDKLPSFVNITVNNEGMFTNGSDVNISIRAPDDITGKVNVTVWDMTRNLNTTYVVYVNEGEGTLHLDAPRIGSYNVTGVYLDACAQFGGESKNVYTVKMIEATRGSSDHPSLEEHEYYAEFLTELLKEQLGE